MSLNEPLKKKQPDRPVECVSCRRLYEYTIGGKPVCNFHYHDMKRRNPKWQDWSDNRINEIIEANPDWWRKDEETASEYRQRMFNLTKRLKAKNEGRKVEKKAEA